MKLPFRGSSRHPPFRFGTECRVLTGTGRGRELRAESRGAIPGRLSPMLDRSGLNGECWLETVREAAGSSERLADESPWRLPPGRHWFQGQCAAKIAFQ